MNVCSFWVVGKRGHTLSVSPGDRTRSGWIWRGTFIVAHSIIFCICVYSWVITLLVKSKWDNLVKCLARCLGYGKYSIKVLLLLLLLPSGPFKFYVLSFYECPAFGKCPSFPLYCLSSPFLYFFPLLLILSFHLPIHLFIQPLNVHPFILLSTFLSINIYIN